MRDIEFRVWDKTKKEMVTDSFDFNLRCLETSWGDHDPYFSIGYPDYYKKHFEIMQFTGLADKNGVKIFEGDIIRTHIGKHFFDDLVAAIGGQFGVALWAQSIGCNTSTNEELVGEYDAVYTYKYKSRKPTGRNLINSGGRTEIIGNIHESPELLENDDE